MVKYKILITGIAGFIGSNLAEYLLKNTDHEVFGIDDLSFGKASNVPEGVVWWEFDITKFDSLVFYNKTFKKVSDFDIVVHCATVNIIAAMNDPLRCYCVNVLGLQILRDAFECPIINLSTSSIYGNQFEGSSQSALGENSPMILTNDYAASKLMAENCLLMHPYPSITLRLSNVYGPRQRPDSPYSGVIGKFLGAILNNEPVEVMGDGIQTRDFTYVDDVCRAIMLCINNNRVLNKELFNVGTAKETSINDLIKAMTAVVDEAVTIAAIPPRTIDNVSRRCISYAYLKSKTLWAPIVSLEEGLVKTYAWMKTYKR